MLLLVSIEAAALLQAAGGDRPPRPTDDQLLAALVAEAPATRVLISDFRDAPRAGGRIGCGLAEVHGRVEPFTVFTVWREAEAPVIRSMTVTIAGDDGRPQVHTVPPPEPKPAGWRTHMSVPGHGDRDQDGDVDHHDRNYDVLRRRTALNLCKDLAPPEGASWPTELEPDPDPARAARNRRLAETTADLLFGSGARQPRPDDLD